MTCPNCGQPYEGDVCPHCGRPARSRGGRIVAVVLAVFLMLPCAAFGACSAVVGVSTLPDLGRNGDTFWLMFGLAAFSVAALVGLGYLVRHLWRS